METKKPYQLYEEEFKKSIVTLRKKWKQRSPISCTKRNLKNL